MVATIRGRLLRDERGQSLIEIMITVFFIAIAVAAVLSLLTAGAIALQRSGQRGTALTLANRQLEYYRTVGYKYARLDHNAIPASGLYVTASSDPTIPPASPLCSSVGQVGCLLTDQVAAETPCGTGPACVPPVQTVTGPDHRSYEIDTYMTYSVPQSTTSSGTTLGRAVKNVLVVVRNAQLTNKPILARNGSTFDQSNLATG